MYKKTKIIGFPLILLLLSCPVIQAKTNKDTVEKSKIDLPQIIRSIALIYTDDKLDPEVEKFLNYKQEIIWEDNAYVYLWGMDRITDDPYATGKEILEKLLEEDKVYDYEKHPYNSSFLEKYTSIELPENDLLCSKIDQGCIKQIFTSLIESKELGQKYKYLIDRYNIFSKFNHFKLISSNYYESPIASYRNLIISQKLFHLSILNKIDKKNLDAYINNLSFKLSSLRYKLKEADTIISKMIVVALIAENIEMLNIIYQKYYMKTDKSFTSLTLAPLTPPELSTYHALYHEHFIGLRMIYDMSIDIERFNAKEYKMPTTLPILRILAFIIIKPNLTVNSQYSNVVKKILYMSKLQPSIFYHKYNTLKIEAHQDSIRNYYAKVLIGDASLNFKSMNLEYQARVFDLDMKIQLLRLLIQSKSIDNLKVGREFLSSYDQTEPYINDSKICYSGLVEVNEKYRCLFILN